MNKTCPACKTIFNGRRERNYCSWDCYKSSRNFTVNCHYCHKVISVSRWRYENFIHLFCNKDCNGKWQSTRTGSLAPCWKDSKKNIKCSYCGKTFRHKKPEEYGAHQFCNRTCYTKFRHTPQWSIFCGGEKSPHWSGGVSFKRGKAWKFLREEIIQRDNHTCQLCGKMETELSRKLSAHHIIPYKCFATLERANNFKNLTSLCISCHMREERRLGNISVLLRDKL